MNRRTPRFTFKRDGFAAAALCVDFRQYFTLYPARLNGARWTPRSGTIPNIAAVKIERIGRAPF
jgi:hypothetical protein